MKALFTGRIDLIRNRERGAARRIHLSSVVLLDNLNVKALCREHIRRFRRELHQKIHAERHICAPKNRHLLLQCRDARKLRFAESRRADDRGHTRALRKVEYGIHGRCDRKVNQHIRALFGKLRKIRINRIVGRSRRAVHTGDNLRTRIRERGGTDLPSHMTATSVQ